MNDDHGGQIDSLYENSSLYQMLFADRRHDLAFYRRATEGRERVLDYGVGAGRVALPLARSGHVVMGVDSSQDMLDLLGEAVANEPRTVRERLSWRLGDARRLQLSERFHAVLCPFNGIAHHHDATELTAFFERVREHMNDDGRFIFDVLLPDPALLAGSSTEIPWFRHPVTGCACRSTQTTYYDALRQVLTIRTEVRPMEGDGEMQVMELHLRQLFPEETLLLVQHHGFVVEQRHDELGDVLAYICRKAS